MITIRIDLLCLCERQVVVYITRIYKKNSNLNVNCHGEILILYVHVTQLDRTWYVFTTRNVSTISGSKSGAVISAEVYCNIFTSSFAKIISIRTTCKPPRNISARVLS